MKTKKKNFFTRKLLLDLSLKDFLFLVAGSFLYAFGVKAFVQPANIAPGGVTAVSLMINHLLPFISIGTCVVALNIPLLILAWRKIGFKFVLRTGLAVLLSAVAMDYGIDPWCPRFEMDRILLVLYGGLICGIGLALVFLAGCTTGGTDIVATVIRKKHPFLQMGRLMLIQDAVILIASIFVFGTIDAALYGMISIFVESKMVDTILYGSDVGTSVSVYTKTPDDITERIIREMDRSATVLKGKGAYSGEEVSVVTCTCRKAEFSRLKAIVSETDPHAFVVVSETSQVFGEGFKNFKED